jgi:hypothetical protein
MITTNFYATIIVFFLIVCYYRVLFIFRIRFPFNFNLALQNEKGKTINIGGLIYHSVSAEVYLIAAFCQFPQIPMNSADEYSSDMPASA